MNPQENDLGAQSAAAVESARSAEAVSRLPHVDPYEDLKRMLRERREEIMRDVLRDMDAFEQVRR